MLEVEDVGRDQPVGERQPALRVGRAIIRHDQVEIEHQPVELLLAQAGAVEQHRARLRRPMLGRDRLGHRRDARVDGLAELLGDELAKLGHARKV